MEAEQTVASVPLFSSLDRRTIERLDKQGKRRVYAAGDPIIRQDAPASALYVILRGKVRVHEGGEDGETIGQLYAGDFFGELALIEDHPRTASVTAIEETECVLFVAWEFTALLKEYPEMATPIMNALIERLHRREHHLGS
ncbi:MAG TPA: cyclic nucleotide-binding domain-containing protein [Candidatus Dormibacteraeota bacterium]|nr:cyclic nucleotide-binding domain-containing protein [Candidatus Dormibacteraeota bacterium]